VPCQHSCFFEDGEKVNEVVGANPKAIETAIKASFPKDGEKVNEVVGANPKAIGKAIKASFPKKEDE